jgi:hypothetical protein
MVRGDFPVKDEKRVEVDFCSAKTVGGRRGAEPRFGTVAVTRASLVP